MARLDFFTVQCHFIQDVHFYRPLQLQLMLASWSFQSSPLFSYWAPFLSLLLDACIILFAHDTVKFKNTRPHALTPCHSPLNTWPYSPTICTWTLNGHEIFLKRKFRLIFVDHTHKLLCPYYTVIFYLYMQSKIWMDLSNNVV